MQGGFVQLTQFFVFSYFLQKGDVSPPQDPVATLQDLLGPLPKLTLSGHPLGVELMNINAYLRPSLMYGHWEGWDGTPLLQPPLLYHGLTESTAHLICSISEEIVNIAKLFQSKTRADMSRVGYSNVFFNCHNFFPPSCCYMHCCCSGPDVQRVDNFIQRIRRYPVDKTYYSRTFLCDHLS